jgi:hypothetical protein
LPELPCLQRYKKQTDHKNEEGKNGLKINPNMTKVMKINHMREET